MAVLGEGTPYQIDCWTGDICQLGKLSYEGGRTVLEITLQPGEATMLLIDTARKSENHVVSTDACFAAVKDGKTILGAFRSGEYKASFPCGKETKVCIDVPAAIPLKKWHLKVEDWNEGERREIHEDRGLGYETTEVFFETKKTMLDAGEVELKPWKDIPAVGEDVSGVGYYSTVFTLPEAFSREENGAVLRLGCTGGCTAAVYINGEKAKGIDFDNPEVDITDLVKPGENTVVVEVSSTLANRLRARGYYSGLPMRFMQLMSENTAFGEMGGSNESEGEGGAGGLFGGKLTQCDVQEYGLTGETGVAFYAVKAI